MQPVLRPRVAVGQEPACVKPARPGRFSSAAEDMKEVASMRIADLKTTGYHKCRPV